MVFSGPSLNWSAKFLPITRRHSATQSNEHPSPVNPLFHSHFFVTTSESAPPPPPPPHLLWFHCYLGMRRGEGRQISNLVLVLLGLGNECTYAHNTFFYTFFQMIIFICRKSTTWVAWYTSRSCTCRETRSLTFRDWTIPLLKVAVHQCPGFSPVFWRFCFLRGGGSRV